MNDLINKLLNLKFICVEIDEDAKFMYECEVEGKGLTIEYLLNASSERRGFISFNTMKAIKVFENEKTLENHHIVIHWFLIDSAIFHLSKPVKNETRIKNCLNESLKCSFELNDIIKEVDALLKKDYTDLREVA